MLFGELITLRQQQLRDRAVKEDAYAGAAFRSGVHWHPEARAYLQRRKDAGNTSKEAMRVLERRRSDIVYRALLADAEPPTATAIPEVFGLAA